MSLLPKLVISRFPHLIGLFEFLIKVKLLKKVHAFERGDFVAGFDYSWKQFMHYGFNKNSKRPKLLLSILASMPKVDRGSLLCVGPRFTDELYYAQKFGFSASGIVGLDTFSYSKRIILGDLHKMPFDSGVFSNVICGWTLPYSTNPKQAISELQRVTKIQGYIAISMGYIDEVNSGPTVPGVLMGKDRVQHLRDLDNLFDKSCRVFGFENFPFLETGRDTIAVYVKLQGND
jgi:Methyltransferase domain